MKSARVVLLAIVCMTLALGATACVAPVASQGGIAATVRAVSAFTEQARHVLAVISTTETTLSAAAPGAPDLYVSEFALNPATPTQGKPVAVRVGVYNKGTAPAGAFKVQWFAGENYPTPACEWIVESLVAKGGRILTCNYAGYPSWYAKLTTKVVVDSGAAVAESDEANNVFKREISVAKP